MPCSSSTIPPPRGSLPGGTGVLGPLFRFQFQLQFHPVVTGGDKSNVGHQHADAGRSHHLAGAGALRGPSGVLARPGGHRGPGSPGEAAGDPTEGQDGGRPGWTGSAGHGQHRHPCRVSHLRSRRVAGFGCCGGCHDGCSRRSADQQPRSPAHPTPAAATAPTQQPQPATSPESAQVQPSEPDPA